MPHELEIDIQTLQQMLQNKESFTLLDVREPWELEKASISQAINIPLSRLSDEIDLLNRNDKIIVMCHHGVRSLNATSWLRQKNVPSSFSLKGGIDAWAKVVDPSVGTY